MPTYEYRCACCGHELELFQQMSESPIRKCPECKRLKLKRLMGAGSGIIFKGSGFYETDYKRKSSRSGSAGQNGKAGSNGTGSKSSGGDSSGGDSSGGDSSSTSKDGAPAVKESGSGAGKD